MDLRDEVEGLIKTAVPGLSLAEIGMRALAALALLLFLGWAFWKLFLADHQAAQKHDQAQVQAQSNVNAAEAAAGHSAVETVQANATKETIIHNTTTDHYHEIIKQPGAGDPVPPAVWDAFQRSICMRASAAGLSDCERLREADPAGLAQGGAVGAAPPE